MTGDPSPFPNFVRKFNLGFNFVLSKTIQKRIIIYLAYCNLINPGNILHVSWLKALLPMVASIVKNGK